MVAKRVGEGRGGGSNGYEVSFCGDENIQDLDTCDGLITS